MDKWQQKFNKPIFFVTPDIKRGLGLEDLLPQYHLIVSFRDELIPVLRKKGVRIFCLGEETGEAILPNNSGRLLDHPQVARYLAEKGGNKPQIAFFKPSLKTEMIIRKKGYGIIGTVAELNRELESKLNLPVLLAGFEQYLLDSETGSLSEFNFARLEAKFGLPLTVQFAFGWAGKNTFFIDTGAQFNKLKNRFPETKVRITRKIDALTFLNNCCLYRGRLLIGPPAIQINGFALLSSNPAATCGRQWPASQLTEEQIKAIKEISETTAKIISKLGFRGFFGLDFFVEKNSGKVSLSEINPRLTASSSFYSYLERAVGRIPLLAYHFAEFSGLDLPLPPPGDEAIMGTQLSLRNRDLINNLKIENEFAVYKYQGKKYKKARRDYAWEKLAGNELIYLPMPPGRNSEEWGRIETKMEAVTDGQLADWVSYLF